MSQEGTYLNVVKVIYGKPTTKIILNGEKLKSFQDKEEGKGTHPHHHYSTQLWKS